MKLLPLLILLLSASPWACKPADQRAAPPPAEKAGKEAPPAADPEIPLCEIDAVDSCEVEKVGHAETVYSCSHCGAMKKKCPDCKGHTCGSCAEEHCRCRMKNKKK